LQPPLNKWPKKNIFEKAANMIKKVIKLADETDTETSALLAMLWVGCQHVGDLYCQAFFPIVVLSGLVKKVEHMHYSYILEGSASSEWCWKHGIDPTCVLCDLEECHGILKKDGENGICECQREDNPNTHHALEIFFEGQTVYDIIGTEIIAVLVHGQVDSDKDSGRET
jgi:hypothetical protein